MLLAIVLAAAGASVVLDRPVEPPDRRERVLRLLSERATHVNPADHDAVAQALIHAADDSGVDLWLLASVVEEESHYRVRARSRKGAVGLMQVRPATARAVAARNDIPFEHPNDLLVPAVNARIGAAYLAELRERFGSIDFALTAYNRGPRKARRMRPREGAPSSPYAGRVLRRYESFLERYHATE